MRNLSTFAILMILLCISTEGFAQIAEEENVMGLTSGKRDPIHQYAATITASDLKAHLGFLASDELEGRETAERGQKLAALYLATQFQKMGLEPVVQTETGLSWYQEFDLQKSKVDEVRISFSSKKEYVVFDDFFTFSRTSVIDDISAPLVFAGYGISEEIYDNLNNLNLVGKAVVVLDGEPMDASGNSLITGTTDFSSWTNELSNKRKLMEEKGASALLVILEQAQFDDYAQNRWLRHMLNRDAYSLKEKDKAAQIPMLFISPEAGEELLKNHKQTLDETKARLGKNDEVSAVNFKKMEFNLVSEAVRKDVSAENVLGFLKGTEKPDEIVIITAHYDHLGVRGFDIFNGADDDGSGTSALLEIAEAFAEAAKNGIKPKRSILFMPVSGEEKGLLGSKHYTNHPVFPLANTVADLNIDMIGRIDEKHEDKGVTDYVYIIGADKLSSELHTINEQANDKYTNLELDYEFNEPDDPNRFYYRSDHYNFAKNNIPVIFYFTGVHKDYHKATDTIEKINFEKMSKIARLVFATGWDLANRDERIIVDQENDFSNSR